MGRDYVFREQSAPTVDVSAVRFRLGQHCCFIPATTRSRSAIPNPSMRLARSRESGGLEAAQGPADVSDVKTGDAIRRRPCHAGLHGDPREGGSAVEIGAQAPDRHEVAMQNLHGEALVSDVNGGDCASKASPSQVMQIGLPATTKDASPSLSRGLSGASATFHPSRGEA